MGTFYQAFHVQFCERPGRVNNKKKYLYTCAGMQVNSPHHLPQKENVPNFQEYETKQSNNNEKSSKKAGWVGKEASHQICFFFFLLSSSCRDKSEACNSDIVDYTDFRRWRGEGKTHITTCTSKQEPNKSHKSSDRSFAGTAAEIQNRINWKRGDRRVLSKPRKEYTSRVTEESEAGDVYPCKGKPPRQLEGAGIRKGKLKCSPESLSVPTHTHLEA